MSDAGIDERLAEIEEAFTGEGRPAPYWTDTVVAWLIGTCRKQREALRVCTHSSEACLTCTGNASVARAALEEP